jgi:hypothetical protein
LLRDNYPLTATDKAVLADYLDHLETKGTAGAKRADHPTNLFTTEWAVHDAASEARKLREFAQAKGHKMTLNAAADVVCKDRIRHYLKGLTVDAVKKRTGHVDPTAALPEIGDADTEVALHEFTTRVQTKLRGHGIAANRRPKRSGN